jgi:hypothetical protein
MTHSYLKIKKEMESKTFISWNKKDVIVHNKSMIFPPRDNALSRTHPKYTVIYTIIYPNPTPFSVVTTKTTYLQTYKKKDENENLVNSKINVFCDFICVDFFHL